MPLDKAGVAAAFDANIDTIRSYVEDDDDLVERYQAAFQGLPEMGPSAKLCDDLSSFSYPGAVPVESFDHCDSIINHHAPSDGWESHEAVDDWARDILLDVPILAVNGSEIPPTTQFNNCL